MNATPDMPGQTDLVLIRYVSIGAAYVDIIGPGDDSTHNRWYCGGCRTTSAHAPLSVLREGANAHAATCRAIPFTPQPHTTVAAGGTR